MTTPDHDQSVPKINGEEVGQLEEAVAVVVRRQQISKGRRIGVVAADHIRRNLGFVKERVLDKLAAASVPADALDNARHFFETLVRDVTLAAHGLTKDALHRIKSHLADILPSLSPALTTKMVDEAEKEAVVEGESERELEEAHRQKQQQESGKAPYVTPASSSSSSSSFASLIKPLSSL